MVSSAIPRPSSRNDAGRRDETNPPRLELYPSNYTSAPSHAVPPRREDVPVETTGKPKHSTATGTILLVSPPNPATAAGPVSQLWQMYQAFEFAKVVEFAARYAQGLYDASPDDVASALVLAAASAFLLGDTHGAKAFAQQAARAYPAALPDPDWFPGAFCRIYAAVMRSERHGR